MNDQATSTPQRDHQPTLGPREVASRWVASVLAGDADALCNLYEVGAALHIEGDVVLGSERIVNAVLDSSTQVDGEPKIEGGRNGMVTLTWPRSPHEAARSGRLRVSGGRIVEQWIGEHRSTTGRLASVPMNMSTSGDVSDEEHDEVWSMVDELVSLRNEAPSYVDVRLRNGTSAGRLDRASLRVTIELPGGSVRASASEADVRSAAQVVGRRLKQALKRRAERRFESHDDRTIRLDNGASSSDRVARRAPSEREVVRHKSVSPGPSTYEEATFDLVSMGYDFFLYVDTDSHRDALVARSEGGSFSRHLDPPRSSSSAARERLDAGNEPFVFFSDHSTGRGHVLYRRLDGHYGLIVPADD